MPSELLPGLGLRRVAERALWGEIHPGHKGHDIRALPTRDASIRAVCLTCLPDDWDPGDGFGPGDPFETLVVTHVQWMKARNKELR